MAELKKTTNTFSISEAIRAGWNLTKKNFWFLLMIFIISNAMGFLLSFITQPFFAQENGLIILIGVLIYIAGYVISLELGFATFAILLKIVDNKKTKIKDLFSYFNAGLLFKFFIISLLYGLIVFFGLILLIIPGIYFGIKYWFALYIFVDKQTGILESFKLSAKLTKNVKWQLFKLCLLQMLIVVAGFLALFVGLLIAWPVNYLSDFYVYRKLSSAKA